MGNNGHRPIEIYVLVTNKRFLVVIDVRFPQEWILGSSPNPETTYQASINRSFLAKGRPQTTPVPVTPVGPVEEGMDAQADSFKPGPKFVACSTYRDAFAPVNKDNLYPIPQVQQEAQRPCITLKF